MGTQKSQGDAPRQYEGGILPIDDPTSPIYVTRPQLPPLEDLIPLLEEMWSSRVLTNQGPFHQELERELRDRWQVGDLSLFSNGTIALLTALQAFQISGEVITTPFSFAATAHAVSWNGLTPVFADIDRTTFNLDPASVEAAITSSTSAIVPVHCYGRPCDTDAFEKIAKSHGLALIYDAAHAFDVRHKGRSLLSFGDAAAISFHATKVFNTLEGGALAINAPEMKTRVDHLKNFGIADETTILAAGINGKMSEFNAAVGLLQLRQIEESITERSRVDREYWRCLEDVPGISLPSWKDIDDPNFSYFPILVNDEYPLSRDALYDLLSVNGIKSRRYFYPLLSETAPYLGSRCNPEDLPNSHWVAERILCLPIYAALEAEQVQRISEVIRIAADLS